MIPKLQSLFHSIIKSLEVLYVIEGIKPCARVLVFEDELNKVIEFLKGNKVNSSISDFKVLKQNAQSEFYSDKSIKVPKNSAEKGYFFVYLSKNKDAALKSKLFEESNNHKELGLLLGYPRCCCDFFEKNFNADNTDLTLNTLDDSDGQEFPFYTNVAARHFDVALLSHFPHSFSCEPSIKIAKENLSIISEDSKELATLFTGLLQCVAVYTREDGIFLLRKYEKISDKIIYGDVLTTTKSKLYYLLSSAKELQVLGKNSFAVGSENIEGKNYGIIIFT